ncbi:MAG: LysM peptidoglycan-binding domain-containing protein [Phototrophicaceae bacterium]
MFNRTTLLVLFLLCIYPINLTQAQDTDCPRPDTWTGTYIVQAGDNLFRIARNNNVNLQTLAEANCISNIRSISVGQVLYLPSGTSSINGFVALTLYNLPADSVMICNADAIQIMTTEVATGDVEQDLRTTLNLFFSDQYRTNSGSGLINTWASFNINVDSVQVENGVATIALSGDFMMIGFCTDAAYSQQLRHNILMYPEIESANVTMNGQNLVAMLDASGLSTQYKRPTNPDLCPIPLGWQPYVIPAQTNLFRIARDVGRHYTLLADRNCLADASSIQAGNTLYLPQLPEQN